MSRTPAQKARRNELARGSGRDRMPDTARHLIRGVSSLPRPEEELRHREKVQRWNLQYPIGTQVRYWPGRRTEGSRVGFTKSAAALLDGQVAVVWIAGWVAAIALSHVQPLDHWEIDEE